jgi:hypothetical protein
MRRRGENKLLDDPYTFEVSALNEFLELLLWHFNHTAPLPFCSEAWADNSVSEKDLDLDVILLYCTHNCNLAPFSYRIYRSMG